MKAALIAAGLGERLTRAGITTPKPLVPVAGTPLIDYVLSAIATTAITEVACIINSRGDAIATHCRQRWPQLHFDFTRRDTPSSMESVFTLAPLLGAERFALFTVDAIFPPRVLQQFLAATPQYPDAHVVLAVTDFVDDEKPLWVEADESGRIRALGDAATGSGLITSGFYVCDPAIFNEIPAARQAHYRALRQFFAHLLQRQYRLYAHRVPATIDVDRPADIAGAAAYIQRNFPR